MSREEKRGEEGKEVLKKVTSEWGGKKLTLLVEMVGSDKVNNWEYYVDKKVGRKWRLWLLWLL